MGLFQRLFSYSQEKELEKEPVAKRLVLDELKAALLAQFSNADGMDGKLKQLLSSASLILSLVTTLQITTGIQRASPVYLAGLVIALLLYIALIVVIVLALRPIIYYAPIPPDWEGIARHYFDKDESAALDLLISTYIEALDKNDLPLNRKARSVTAASILLVLIVIALIVMGVWGLGGSRLFPTP